MKPRIFSEYATCQRCGGDGYTGTGATCSNCRGSGLVWIED